jgi:hypothetical protein
LSFTCPILSLILSIFLINLFSPVQLTGGDVEMCRESDAGADVGWCHLIYLHRLARSYIPPHSAFVDADIVSSYTPKLRPPICAAYC